MGLVMGLLKLCQCELYDWFTDIPRPIREISVVEGTRKLERFSSLLVFRTAYIHRLVLGTVGSTSQEILQLHRRQCQVEGQDFSGPSTKFLAP